MTLLIIENLAAILFITLVLFLTFFFVQRIAREKLVTPWRSTQLLVAALTLALAHTTWKISVAYQDLKLNQLILKINPPPPTENQQAKDSPVAQFLTAMNQALSDPSKVSDQTIQNLQAQRKTAYESKEQQLSMEASIQRFHSCQKIFFQEALKAFESGKVQPGNEFATCKSETGVGFGREKLFPDEVLKNVDALLKAAANKTPLPAGDGKTSTVTKDSLVQSIQLEQLRLDLVLRIFSNN